MQLDLFVKNVPTLLVKVFEINTANFYRTQLREVDTDINLDGLVANDEKTHQYDEPPLRRVARRFEFPELTKPGVYVIDFIGNGKSSRALVRKGRLRAARRRPAPPGRSSPSSTRRTSRCRTRSCGSAGRSTRPTRTADRPCRSARAGPPADRAAQRRVRLPRLRSSTSRRATASSPAFTSIAKSLLTQRIAPVLVRPALFLNGRPVSVKLLEEVKLRITSTDHRRHRDRRPRCPTSSCSRTASRSTSSASRRGWRRSSVTLTAKVKSLSRSKPIDLAAGRDVRAQRDRPDRQDRGPAPGAVRRRTT